MYIESRLKGRDYHFQKQQGMITADSLLATGLICLWWIYWYKNV